MRKGGAGLTAILDPRYYVPGELMGMYGNGWFYWYTNALEATQIEPPEDIKEIRVAYEQVGQQPSLEGQIEAMSDLLEVAADNFWVIGISRPAPGFQPYHQRLGNYPDEWVKGWVEGVEKITYPEQWYIKQ